jgi:hypothetical protein
MAPLLAAEPAFHLPTVWQLLFSVLMATATAFVIWAAIFWRAVRKKQVSVNSVMVLMALEGAFLAITLWLIGWRP